MFLVFHVFLGTLRPNWTSSAYDMHDQIRGKLSLNLNAQKVEVPCLKKILLCFVDTNHNGIYSRLFQMRLL